MPGSAMKIESEDRYISTTPAPFQERVAQDCCADLIVSGDADLLRYSGAKSSPQCATLIEPLHLALPGRIVELRPDAVRLRGVPRLWLSPLDPQYDGEQK